MSTNVGNVGSYLYASVGLTSANREDLIDWIANIDPYDTPLTVSLAKVRAAGVHHQWMTDALAATSTAGLNEGLDWEIPTLTSPTRVVNFCQIFGKDIAVTETQRAENPAGFSDAYAYQLEKGTKEVMRNIEATLMAAVTASTGGSATASARVMKSLETFITTNKYDSASYASSGSATTVAGIFGAADVNRILDLIWTAGGNPDLIVMGGAYKRHMSALTSPNTRNILAEQKKVVVGIDVYDSDFGLIPIQLNRWSPVATNATTSTNTSTDISGRVWFLTRSMVRLAWLRDLQHRLMGTRGDSTVGQIRAELTLEVGNQKSCGVFTGVNNKTANT